MAKSILLPSIPSIKQKILNRPTFSTSPPFGKSVGQPLLGQTPRVWKYEIMESPSEKIKETLSLPETEPVHVVKGYDILSKDMETRTPKSDLNSAAEEYFQEVKTSRQDSYNEEPSSVVEKNEAALATALAAV